MIAELSPRQVALVEDALGLIRRPYPFRNWFIADVGTPTAAEWHVMVAIGAAELNRRGSTTRHLLFHVTRDAANRVLQRHSLPLVPRGTFPGWLE